MYCPNCGNKNSADQKFCRSCGLGLEKIAQSLTEQLPTKSHEGLQERKEKFEKLGMVALGVFGLGVLSFILYGIFYKLMLTQGNIMAGLGALAGLIIVGSGLLSVVLFAKANEVKEASAKRQIQQAADQPASTGTTELLPESHPKAIFSVTERTTDLLLVEKKGDAKKEFS